MTRTSIHALRLLLAAALAVLAVVRGPERESAASPQDAPREIVIAIQQEPDSLHPLFMEMMASTEIAADTARCGAIWRGLSFRDDTWDLKPCLAERIPTIENGDWTVFEENGQKKMKVLWHIRKEACWADGHPLTADDFVFTFNLKMNEKIRGIISKDLERRVEKMEAQGEDHKTLVVTYKELYAYADEGYYVIPKHLEEPLFLKDPEKYNELSPMNTLPVGNGPYQVTEWERGSRIVMERNPHFWGPKPILDRITYCFITDTNTLLANVKTGEVDAISPVGISFDQALKFAKKPAPGYKVDFVPGLVWEHVDVNLENPWLADKRVRQALLSALNRGEIVDKLFEGRQEISHSWVPPKHYGYDKNLRTYPYDPAKAAALLAEAGWKPGSDGILVNGAGERLHLVIMTTSGNALRERVEQVMQNQWKKIGIELEIQNQEGKVFFGETMRKRQFKHLAMYAWTQGPVQDGEILWTTKNIPTEANGWTGQNYPAWKNAEADRIDNLIPQTLDRAERVRLYAQEQAIWTDELPALPLYFRMDTPVSRTNLKEWRVTGSDCPATWNSEFWSFGPEDTPR